MQKKEESADYLLITWHIKCCTPSTLRKASPADSVSNSASDIAGCFFTIWNSRVSFKPCHAVAPTGHATHAAAQCDHVQTVGVLRGNHCGSRDSKHRSQRCLPVRPTTVGDRHRHLDSHQSTCFHHQPAACRDQLSLFSHQGFDLRKRTVCVGVHWCPPNTPLHHISQQMFRNTIVKRP